MIDPTKTVVIVNPAAGAGRAGVAWPAHERALREHLGPCEVHRTRGPGDATEVAAAAVRAGATAVVSMGGDGTHNEILCGVMRAEPAPGAVAFGVLPAGTGGDFCRMLSAGHDLDAAARGLREAPGRLIDVGVVSFRGDDGAPASRHFLNIASLGLSGLVDRLVNAGSKRLGGRATFFLATLRAAARYRPVRLRLEIDGRIVEEPEVSTIAVCNGRFAGGGMMFAPDASLDDGLLDVVVLRHAPIWTGLAVTRALYRGEHVHFDAVGVYRGREVSLTPVAHEAFAFLDVDGEAPGFGPSTFRVVPGAIRLLGAR